MKANRTSDNECQIRIRRYRSNYPGESRETHYEVSLGFWIDRGTRRIWHTERKAYLSFHDTLAEATAAANAPKIVAARDDMRRRRGNPVWGTK